MMKYEQINDFLKNGNNSTFLKLNKNSKEDLICFYNQKYKEFGFFILYDDLIFESSMSCCNLKNKGINVSMKDITLDKFEFYSFNKENGKMQFVDVFRDSLHYSLLRIKTISFIEDLELNTKFKIVSLFNKDIMEFIECIK